jgi:hypothetical protein
LRIQSINGKITLSTLSVTKYFDEENRKADEERRQEAFPGKEAESEIKQKERFDQGALFFIVKPEDKFSRSPGRGLR